MELPTGMLAYRVLKCVGILANKQQLARATLPGLTYNCMKKQLKAIYDNISQENNLSSVKVEPVFEARGCNGTNSQNDDYYQSNKGQNNSFLGSKERGRFGKVETNQNGHGKGSILIMEKKEIELVLIAKLLVLVYMNQYTTGLRIARAKNQTYINTATLPFLLKRHRNVLWKTFLGKTLNLAVLIVGALKL